ncbi:MAG: UDP-N-acetylmuramate dehydrogenase [Treponema sp.]|nr:UDP-N-acetylmuramate dehydrogenase [Treponema sp.]
MKKQIDTLIKKCFCEAQCEADIRYNEPMKNHTTFKVGGPADCLIRPDGEGFSGFCIALLKNARDMKIPVFILGGGANIVVSDKGIRGIVLDMTAWTGKSVLTLFENDEEIIFKSGTGMDEAACNAAALSLTGLEFLAGMPGTIGGAVWMNARCYGSEIADVLSRVEIIAYEKNEYIVKRIEIEKEKNSCVPLQDTGFDYKQSPFQKMDCIILSAAFKLNKGDKEEILVKMNKNKKDRFEKGHYKFPCAGSAFKNNRDFGKPAGQIIDELGLKGLKKGGAQIAPFHGNFIINTGNAKAKDIRTLVNEVTAKVKKETGFTLEPEILFVGER